MRWRQLIGLYVVLAVLAGEYWFVERRVEPRPEAQPARPPFLTIRPDALREVRLVRGGLTVMSRREAGQWIVVEPPDAPIMPGLIAAFTQALASAEEIGRMGGAGADLGEYGLDDRATRVQLIPEAGGAVTVTIGDPNPTGTAVYAQRAGSLEVVLIGRNIRYYEDLIFQALATGHSPAVQEGAPIGGA